MFLPAYKVPLTEKYPLHDALVDPIGSATRKLIRVSDRDALAFRSAPAPRRAGASPPPGQEQTFVSPAPRKIMTTAPLYERADAPLEPRLFPLNHCLT